MRFGPEIINNIIAELEKIPNIRYVCNKVGIDHSTFYRWIMLHPTFKKKVTVASFIGKRAISGMAESVIIRGVQNGDFRAATFWLNHNEYSYMDKSKGEHHGKIMSQELEMMKEKIKYDGSNFETVFKYLQELERTYGTEVGENVGKFMIDFFCNNDQNLVDVFNASYENHKKELAETNEKAQNFDGLESISDDSESNLTFRKRRPLKIRTQINRKIAKRKKIA